MSTTTISDTSAPTTDPDSTYKPPNNQSRQGSGGKAAAKGPTSNRAAPNGPSRFAGHYLQRLAEHGESSQYLFWVVLRDTREKQLAIVGEDENGMGKFSYNSVADFDHRGLPRLWKATRRQAMEWLEAMGAATPLNESGEAKKSRPTPARKQGQGGSAGRTTRTTRKQAASKGPQSPGKPSEVVDVCVAVVYVASINTHSGMAAGSRLPTRAGSWYSPKAPFLPASRLTRAPTLHRRARLPTVICPTLASPTRFDRVVDHHVAHNGQRVHLIYLVNSTTAARLLVAQGQPLHPSSSVLVYTASDCVGGYQLQDSVEAMHYASHLLHPPDGPATPATGSVRTLLDTVTAPAAAAGMQQRAVSPSVQAAFARNPSHLNWIRALANQDDIARFQQHAQLLINPVVPDGSATATASLTESQALAVLDDLARTNVSLHLLEASGIVLPLGGVALRCQVPSVQRRAANIALQWREAAASCLFLASKALAAQAGNRANA